MSDLSSQTNTSLFHAQNLLALAASQRESFSSSHKVSVDAGARALLKDAWLAWLNELGDLMNQNAVAPSKVNDFLLPPLNELPDVQYLINLNMQPNTWLRLMLDRIDPELVNVGASNSARKKAASEKTNTINLVSLDDKNHVSEEDILDRIVKEFKQYINEVRSQHVEW